MSNGASKKKTQAENGLCLSGSQINLASRPQSANTKSKSRPMSACGFRLRRPLSAISSHENQERFSQDKISNKLHRRPLSADTSYVPVNDYIDVRDFIRVKSLGEQLGNKHTVARGDVCKDLTTRKEGSITNLGDTYILESSKLASDMIAEDLNRTYTKIKASDLSDSSDETETLRSESSTDTLLSEKSGNQKIKTGSKHLSQQSSLGGALPLTPGLTGKPPLPHTGAQNRNVSHYSSQGFDESASYLKDVSEGLEVLKFDNDTNQHINNNNIQPNNERLKLQDLLDEAAQCMDVEYTLDKEPSLYSSPSMFNRSHAEQNTEESIISKKHEIFEHVKFKNTDSYNSELYVDKGTDYITDVKFKRFFENFNDGIYNLGSMRVLESIEEMSNINSDRSVIENLDNEDINQPKQNDSPELDIQDLDVQENVSLVSRFLNSDENINDQKTTNASLVAINEDLSALEDTKSWLSSHIVSLPKVTNMPDIFTSAAIGNEETKTVSNYLPEADTNQNSHTYVDLKDDFRPDVSRQLGSSSSTSLKSVVDLHSDYTAGAKLPVSKLKMATMDPSVNSTYDDIVSILKDLEDEQPFNLVDATSKETSELINNINTSNTQSGGHNVNPATGSKLKEILGYLDEIDQNCNTALDTAKHRIQAVRDTARSIPQKSTVPRLDDLLNMSNVDLAHDVLTLKLQLEEKNNSVSILQEALNEQRELNLRNTRNADKELKTRLKQQKQELEGIINRHQKFIDQLIAEKKDLNQKYESVVSELKASEDRHANNLKAIEQRHSIELDRAKQMHAAAEKLRRERWIDNKTQKIKEMTVKGLEPELQRMTVRHQQELSDLRALHKKELEDVELRATRRNAQQMEQLRDQMLTEKEEALAKERELLRQRMEKQLQEDEMAYQEQRKRLIEEVRKEKEKLEEERNRVKEELEEMKISLTRECEKNVEKARKEYKESLDEINRKHQNELKMTRENLEMEKEAWIHSYKKEQNMAMAEKEKQIREQLTKERNREIEIVIEKLENESVKNKAELEQAADNRLRRLREKYENELKDLEASEESLRNKYTETKRKLIEREDNVINLEATVRQLENELQESRKIADRLSSERAELKEVVRRELASQISTLEQEMIKSKEELAETRVRCQLELASKAEEIAKLSLLKEKELHEVYQRVKVAIAKKDDTIQQLKTQHESALERCCHLECLLEQQRKDFLLK